MNNRYNLGLDLGITSVGSSIIDMENKECIELSTRVFKEAVSAKEARLYRSQRRNMERKKWRKKQLIDAFVDFHLLTREEVNQENYLSYTANTAKFVKPTDDTVYHLRKRALSEQVSKRELLLCLYSILHARGHFLIENVDFSKSNITFDVFKEYFYKLSENYIDFTFDKKDFEEKVLKIIFEESIKSKELKKLFQSIRINDEENRNSLFELLKLICGFTARINIISEELSDEEYKTNISELKQSDDVSEYLAKCVEVFDLIHIHQTLKKHEYICETAVELLDEQKRLEKDKDSDEYKKFVLDVKNKMTVSSNHPNRLRVIRNIENNYPNGLYLKEISAILHKQQAYYEKEGLTDNFIEVCLDIASAKIPYFIGPLSENGTNSWVEKKANVKYSYAYSMKYLDSINEEESIKKWKERMISHCTYLNEEKAMPKGSFIGETFNIINELNVLTAKDKNDEEYYLTHADKIKVFDEIFLKEKEYIAFDKIKDLLNLQYFGTRNNSRIKIMNNRYTLYHHIVAILPELKIDSINEIFNKSKKVERIEEIILTLNLFTEEKIKKNFFESNFKYKSEIALKLSKLDSIKFMSISRKLVMDYPLNAAGESMMEMLFDNNTSDYTNEQMTLLTNATDKDGKKINLSANKYEKILKENGGKLDINLLIDKNKPILPISRPVIRALNECFKVYTEIIKFYGVPKRVVIETARDLKDRSIIKEKSIKHFDNMKAFHKYVSKTFANNKEKICLECDIEDWEEVEHYYSEKSKRKIELYIRQNGHDLITNEPIDITKLNNYEIDHILPIGFGDDSMNDKILISKTTNAKKGNRLPIEFLKSQEGIDYIRSLEGGDSNIKSYKQRIEDLHSLNMISKNTKERLLIETKKEFEGFINRNLVDTRYIISELISILKCYNTYHGYDTHIVALNSSFTSMFRKAFNIKKNRDYGVQHHAYDAAMVSIADRVLSEYFPNYDERRNKNYSKFIHELKEVSENNGTKIQKDKIGRFIRYIYRCSLHEDPMTEYSLISKIKQIKPLYSLKVEKNYKGKLFNATLLSPSSNEEGGKVLDILKVNNSKRSFSDINCVAVDFYKFTDKSGKKKHVTIHIPYLIINDGGEINQEKYKDLIRYHYKETELLDENNNIIEKYFRFRAFKNDLIYDTNTNTVQIFNIGSIVKDNIVKKNIDIFSYNDIYLTSCDYRRRIIKHFDLYNKKSEEQIKFEDLDKNIVINYTIDELMTNFEHTGTNKSKKIRLNIQNKLIKAIGLNEFTEKAAFLNLVIGCKILPCVIEGPIIRKVNNRDIKGNPDAQYIKLKYCTLGIRFENKDGTLFIEGPKYHSNAYTKIKREKFTWNLMNDML